MEDDDSTLRQLVRQDRPERPRSDQAPTKLVFEPGDTRTIDLPGDVRAIRDIELRYGDVPGGGRAHVQMWTR